MPSLLRVRYRPIVLCLALTGWSAAVGSREATAAPDLELKLGLVRGTITVPKSESLPVARQFTFGGVSPGVAVVGDVSANSMVYGGATITLDSTNHQIVQQGFDIGYGYHLLGGRRHQRSGSDTFYVDSRNTFNLSLLLQAGQHNYATAGGAAETSADIDKVTGGVADMGFGFEYRSDLSDQNAIGVQALTTFMAFSMSTSRLTATTQAVFLFWRFTF